MLIIVLFFFCSFSIDTRLCQLIRRPDVPSILNIKVGLLCRCEYLKKFLQYLSYLEILSEVFTHTINLPCIAAANEVEGVALHAIVPLQDLSENTFLGHMEAEEGLHQKLLELRDRNGGQLPIIYYIG